MQVVCSPCAKALEYSGDRPRFCSSCGSAISAATATAMVGLGVRLPVGDSTRTPAGDRVADQANAAAVGGGGPLPVEEAVAKILDVIDGLREAHRLGLVHGDGKPSNCCLEASGRGRICVFGLARSLLIDSSVPRTGAFIGTPLCAAPE